MKTAFIGLGQMGAPMARNLLATEGNLTVFDINPDNLNLFADSSADLARTAGEAVVDADIIFTMLPNSQVVNKVVLGAGGVLSVMKSCALLVDMSSSHPIETQKLGDQVIKSGRRMVDAPVSGGVARAKAGSLSIMAGGEEKDIKKAIPYLEKMGTSVFCTGPLGSAHALKALNNLLSASGLLAAAEVLLMGQRFGLDASMMIKALNESSGMNNATKNKFPDFVLTRRFDSGFSLDLMVKDLSIALDLAKDSNMRVPLSAMTYELAQSAQKMLGHGHDHTEAVRILEEMCGDEIAGNDMDDL